jgi:hypothetical protein
MKAKPGGFLATHTLLPRKKIKQIILVLSVSSRA